MKYNIPRTNLNHGTVPQRQLNPAGFLGFLGFLPLGSGSTDLKIWLKDLHRIIIQENFIQR